MVRTAKTAERSREKREHEIDIEILGSLIKAGSIKNVIVCAGAGISSMLMRMAL